MKSGWKKEITLILAALLLINYALAQQSGRPRTVEPGQAGSASLPKHEELLKRLTPDEQSALSQPANANDRMKTYARLTAARLKGIRAALDRQDYAALGDQLEGYTALVGDAGRFAKESVPLRDKAHKTLEQALREQLRLLESVLHDTPAAHLEQAERASATAGLVRRQALNALIGDGQFLLSPPERDKPKPNSEGQPQPNPASPS